MVFWCQTDRGDVDEFWRVRLGCMGEGGDDVEEGEGDDVGNVEDEALGEFERGGPACGWVANVSSYSMRHAI